MRVQRTILKRMILAVGFSSGPFGLLLPIEHQIPTDPQIAATAESRENASQDCAICHIDWIQSLESEATETRTDSVDKGRLAGTADMCLSCHDGSVVDSRLKVWMSDHHVTGRVPPEWVDIPTDKFPLDEEGKMTCATCHSAHPAAEDPGSDIATVVFLRRPNVDSSLCLMCHSQFSRQESVHHPLGKQADVVSATLRKAGGKTTADGTTIICQTCHQPHGSTNPKMLVLPVTELCVSCHSSQSAELSHFPTEVSHRMGATFPGFVPPRDFIDKGAQFGPRGELSCLSCHRMHRGANKQALLIAENRQGSLCKECHKTQQTVLGSTHDMGLNAAPPDALNADDLTAGESGVCGACHKSRGWAREKRPGETANSAFCVECHLEGGLAWEKRPYVEVHPVNVSLPDDRRTDLPVKGGERELTCATCHDPHSDSDSIFLLRMSGNDLCLNCHEGKQGIFTSMHDPANGSWAEEVGLEARGLCTDCHQVHRARDKAGIWALLEQKGENQLTCEGCHNSEGPGKPAQTRHLARVMESASVFPLAKPDPSSSGSISCATCHEIHQQTKGNKLLRASRNDSKICLQCHPHTNFLIDTSHDFRTSAPDAPNILGEKAEESGPCETCHLIHDARHGMGPWAFEPAGSDEYVKNLCVGCHQTGKLAERFLPSFADHPDTALFNRIKSDETGFLPLYGKEGEHSTTGLISCLSCHDPHLSKADTESDTPGPGSSIGKFLRPYSQQNLCVDCHGREAIWRYLYFHKKRTFPSRQIQNQP